MSEIKGQLLGIILVLMIFGAIGGALTTVFTNLKESVVTSTTKITGDVEEYYTVDGDSD